ncbi:MAG: hypothetical protein WD061_00940 [Candidatus Saccharimonadales bacterium]
MKDKGKLASIFIVAMLLIAPYGVVLAQVDTTPPDQPGAGSQPSLGDSSRQDGLTRTQQARSDGVSATVCQRQLDNINRLTSQVVAVSQRQIEIFDTIFERVDRLYFRLELEADEYNEQVVEVASKRNEAYRRLDSMEVMSEEFSCEVGDFRVKINEFRDARFELLSLLRDYRSSIVDLIVMIQTSATGQDNNQQSSDDEDQNQDQSQNQNNSNSSGDLL